MKTNINSIINMKWELNIKHIVYISAQPFHDPIRADRNAVHFFFLNKQGPSDSSLVQQKAIIFPQPFQAVSDSLSEFIPTVHIESVRRNPGDRGRFRAQITPPFLSPHTGRQNHARPGLLRPFLRCVSRSPNSVHIERAFFGVFPNQFQVFQRNSHVCKYQIWNRAQAQIIPLNSKK